MVTRDLAKVETAGSSPVYRSNNEKDIRKDILFRCRSEEEPLPRAAASCLRFAPVRAEQTSTGRLAPVYRFIRPIRGSKFERLHFVSVVSKPTSTGCRETVRAKPRSTGPRAPSIALTTKRIFERSLLSESIKKVTWGQQSQHIQYLST